MQKQKIDNLCQTLLNICFSHTRTKWSNGWQNNKKGKLKYHYLIWQESDHTLHYQDIDGVSIELEYTDRYRIDLRVGTFSNNHNFWRFDDKDWLFVETYIKELVTHQFNSIEKLYEIMKLTNDAYFEIKPEKMYKAMTVKLRKEKLEKLNGI